MKRENGKIYLPQILDEEIFESRKDAENMLVVTGAKFPCAQFYILKLDAIKDDRRGYKLLCVE